jgi:tetratricopeptide (TPR) repeat protein
MMLSKENYLHEIEKSLNNNNLRKAKVVLDELLIKIKEAENDSYVQLLIAIYHIKEEQYELAISHLLSIVNSTLISIYYPRAIKLLAFSYIRLEHYDQAREILLDIVEELMEDLQVKNMLAYTHYIMGEIEVAFKEYFEVLNLDAQNLTAMNAVSYCLTNDYDRPKEAIDLLNRYEVENNGDPRILDTLAWAYYKNGNQEKAEKYIQKAFEKMPTHTIIKDHITKIISI